MIESDHILTKKEEVEEEIVEDKMRKSEHRRQFSHQIIDPGLQNGRYEHRSFFTKLEHKYILDFHSYFVS